MVRCALSSVILHRDSVDVPHSGWVCRLTHCDVEMVSSNKASVRPTVQREHHHEPALRRGIVPTARVGHKWPTNAGCAVDCCRVTVERVQVYGMVHIPWKTTNDVG